MIECKEEKQSAVLHQQKLESFQKELVRLQVKHRAEIKKLHRNNPNVPFRQSSTKTQKSLDKTRRKLASLEAQLMMESPHLRLTIYDSAHKSHTILMASDYERNNWKDTIMSLSSKEPAAVRITDAEIQNLINAQKVTKLIGSVSDNDLYLEEERLDGILNVTIHQLSGPTEAAGKFCTIEIDSFGHFSLRAKTNNCKSSEPKWNEDFDIEIEGAQTLNILCYRIGQETDNLLGKCSFELNKAWLDEEFTEKAISLGNEMVLTVSLKFTSADQMLKRFSRNIDGSLFAVPLECIARRETTTIPLLVTACVFEIESRGLKEVGLYRVSGLASEVERLKKAFNKSSTTGSTLVKGADTSVLTSLLKLFFRELPEVLFTDKLYPNLVKGIGLADPDGKEKYMTAQLKTLPNPNYDTANFIIGHLVKVSRNMELNKMSLANLATVFGPTLLRPTVGDENISAMDLFCRSVNDVATQSNILLYYLNLAAFTDSGRTHL